LSSGLQSIERKDYGAACSELERAASEDSSDWRILLALGHARLRLGQFEQARTALTRSLFIQPDDANAWLRMSEIQAVKGDTAGSRAALRLAIYLSHQRTRALDYLDNADDNTLAPQFQTIVHAERGALDKLPRRTS
jgi:Flp pilus assembly protein TadD